MNFVFKATILIAVMSLLCVSGMFAQETPTPTNTPTIPQEPTQTMTPRPTMPPMNTPTPTETPIPLRRLAFDCSIPESSALHFGDIWSMALAMYAEQPDWKYCISVTVSGYSFYFPSWVEDSTCEPYLQPVDEPGVSTRHIFSVPFLTYFVGEATFDARLFEPGLDGYREIEHVQRVVRFDAQEPTPTPTPEGPCQAGYAIVDVSNIPIMDNGNKEALNKQLFFCLRDNNDINFVGVYHRYLQPDWPYGNWWATWRVEAGAPGCTEEWNIWSSSRLPGNFATFKVEWTQHSVTVTHLGTGDSQSLHLSNDVAYDGLFEDDACGNWGWSSDAVASLVEWHCDQTGNPSYCH